MLVLILVDEVRTIGLHPAGQGSAGFGGRGAGEGSEVLSVPGIVAKQKEELAQILVCILIDEVGAIGLHPTGQGAAGCGQGSARGGSEVLSMPSIAGKKELAEVLVLILVDEVRAISLCPAGQRTLE